MFIEAFDVDYAGDSEPLPVKENDFVVGELLILLKKLPLHSHGTTSHNTYEGNCCLYA